MICFQEAEDYQYQTLTHKDFDHYTILISKMPQGCQ